MSVRAEAWFIHARKSGEPRRAELVREPIEVPDPRDHEVQLEPLFGCWEGNMSHAVNRNPIDVCKQRGEEKVVLGNAGLLRVLAVGNEVRGLEPGQYVICSNVAAPDRYGYPTKIHAYDAVGTVGCLATRLNLPAETVVPLPRNTRHRLEQWAAFSLRFVTAWSNWELAYGVLRLLVAENELPHPHVWGWGGGTTLAELSLAARFGCRVAMLSGNEAHRAEIREYGIEPIDRHTFGELQYRDDLYSSDADFRQRYTHAETAFLSEVRRRTEGEMVHIFVDFIGGPVYRATLKALAREGVITTAGWREGMALSYLRAKECIERHQHVHTHHARRSQCLAAVQYAEETGWLPRVRGPVYKFDEIHLLAEAAGQGEAGLFPIYAVNPIS